MRRHASTDNTKTRYLSHSSAIQCLPTSMTGHSVTDEVQIFRLQLVF